MLNIAKGEPWTDGGWIKIQPKIQKIGSKTETTETRCDEVASDERRIQSNGHDETIDEAGIANINTMKKDHCMIHGDSEHGRVHVRSPAERKTVRELGD